MPRWLMVAVVFLGLAAATAPTAADPAFVDLIIEQDEAVTVGDRVSYRVVLEVSQDTDVTLDATALPPAVSLVAAPEVSRRSVGDGRERVTLSFQLAAFAVGDIAVTPLQVRFQEPGGASGVIETPASVIEVASVLPPAGQVSPRDLKPQAEIGSAPPAWPLPVAAALVTALVFLLLAALVRRQLRRRNEARAWRLAPVLSGPEDIARGILHQTGLAFIDSRDYVRFYTQIGNTVRYYLTQRYGFPAFAMTTRELEEAMVERGLDRWQIRVATGLLNQCDAVVYAQYRPALERADADLTAAYEIVEMSRPEERPLQQEEEAPVA